MATWNKILTEKEVKNRTLNTILGQTAFNGVKAGHVNFMKPISSVTGSGVANGELNFPHLEFSDNQTLDNKAIKRWTYGPDETGSDSTTAYFDLVGNQTMDDVLNPGLAKGLMGCVTPVPMGRSDVGFHDIELNFAYGHEGTSPTSTFGVQRLHLWRPTIWRAYANDELTALSGNANAFKFRLVSPIEFGAWFGQARAQDSSPGHQFVENLHTLRVPINSSGDSWVGKTCYYMLGFHVDEDIYLYLNGSQPQTSSMQFPSAANTVTGLKQCSIIANFRVTYTAN